VGKGVALSAILLALAAAGCDPVATSAGGGGAGAAAASVSSEGAASSVSVETAPLKSRLEAADGKRLDALERALMARDSRIRELDEALASLAERNAKELADLRAAMEEAVKRLSGENGALRNELESARRTVEALRAASPLPNLSADVPRIEGRVLSLDRAADGAELVLLDVGEKQGVRKGYELTILRGGRALAKLVVERLEAQFASGRVIFSKDGEAIQAGDLATTRP